jgi:hypothetical protein
MAVLVQTLFFLISLAQFTNMFFVFLDMKEHEKRKTRANGVSLYFGVLDQINSPPIKIVRPS